MERVDLDVATEFLLIAATLVELKARRLLPGREDVDLDEELMRFEERDLLLARLLECKTFQDAARVMNERLQSASRSIARVAGPEEPFRSLAPEPVEEVETTHIAPIRASVRDAIDTVLALLPERGSVQFRELTYGVSGR